MHEGISLHSWVWGGGGSEDLPENFFEKRMQMVRSETILADCVFISFFLKKFIVCHKTGADKSHCPTPWESAFIGGASGFVEHNFITDK